MKSSGAEPVARLVLDTSAYSRLRLGHDMVLDSVAAAEMVLLPATVLGELDAAFELGSREKENRVVLTEFLDEPFVSIVPPMFIPSAGIPSASASTAISWIPTKVAPVLLQISYASPRWSPWW